MPEVAANAVAATLAGWPVDENTAYAAGDAIATVETEKAIVDVAADSAGVILKILVTVGSEVGVGDPIALLGDVGEPIDDLDAALARLGASSSTVTRVVAPEAEPNPVKDAVARTDPSQANDNPSNRVFSSPLARRIAKEAGLSLAELTATGQGGRVVRRDVDSAIQARTVSGSADPGTDSRLEAHSAEGSYIDVPHTRIRRTIASRLTESVRDAPHFSIEGTARVDKLLKLRAKINVDAAVRVSVNDLMIMAAAKAHVMVPTMNAIWTPDAVRVFSQVDISIAVATDRGLFTPVLRGVQQMTASSIASASHDVIDRARAGRLRQEELEGGTLTVTNLGSFGTERFSAIINPPQSAILAVGAAIQQPLVSKGRLGVGTQIRLTLTVDHRPIDGAVAAQWMAAFISLLEEPVRILA